MWESADKPGSVIPLRAYPRGTGSHSSGRGVARRALATYPQASVEPTCRYGVTTTSLAYLVLLRMEVAAFHPPGFDTRGLVSVALFVTSPCQGVTLHPALRSPDFPPCIKYTAAAKPTPACNFTARGGA
jgi:hypothetical protein